MESPRFLCEGEKVRWSTSSTATQAPNPKYKRQHDQEEPVGGLEGGNHHCRLPWWVIILVERLLLCRTRLHISLIIRNITELISVVFDHISNSSSAQQDGEKAAQWTKLPQWLQSTGSWGDRPHKGRQISKRRNPTLWIDQDLKKVGISILRYLGNIKSYFFASLSHPWKDLISIVE